MARATHLRWVLSDNSQSARQQCNLHSEEIHDCQGSIVNEETCALHCGLGLNYRMPNGRLDKIKITQGVPSS